jgi:hypothetical protein
MLGARSPGIPSATVYVFDCLVRGLKYVIGRAALFVTLTQIPPRESSKMRKTSLVPRPSAFV